MICAAPSPRILAIRFCAWRIANSATAPLSETELADAMDLPDRELRRALRGQRWARPPRLRRPDLDALETASRFAERMPTE